MDVDNHAIALVASNCRLDHNKCISVDKVANAALFLVVFAAAVSRELESKSSDSADKQQHAAEPLQW